jgi:DNA-binding MarR family transcriptional regulator
VKKITIIHTEKDLAVAVQETLDNDPDLSWRIGKTPDRRNRADAVIHLKIDGHNYPFLAEYKLKPSFDLIGTLARKPTPPNHSWLLVTPRLTERFVALCREAGIACLDLNGRAWIRRGPLLIDRAGRRDGDAVVAVPPAPDLFSAKSSRLARALLSPRAEWSQADLAAQTGISRPLLSRLLDTLNQQGFVRREGSRRGGRWIVSQPDAFLDEWARRDAWPRRVTVHQYSLLLPAETIAEQVKSTLGAPRVVFTQWFAARLRHPYTDAPIVSAYVESLPSADVLKSLTAREVQEGGRLWLLVSKDDGVFQFTQTINGLPLVSDAQIYLDLLQVGLRGPDAAQALRNWEGFRR